MMSPRGHANESRRLDRSRLLPGTFSNSKMKKELKRQRAELKETDEKHPRLKAIIDANWDD